MTNWKVHIVVADATPEERGHIFSDAKDLLYLFIAFSFFLCIREC